MVWIVREGVVGPHVKGTGRHLWGVSSFPRDFTLGTAGGGSWRTGPDPLAAWWMQGQCGALRYSSRDAAWRDAARVNGRVIRLRPRSTSAVPK